MSEKNSTAQYLANLRWSNTPMEDRGQHVGRNGGRPRNAQPTCPSGKHRSHHWRNDRCVCGAVRGSRKQLARMKVELEELLEQLK
jgi:hypothetical protein